MFLQSLHILMSLLQCYHSSLLSSDVTLQVDNRLTLFCPFIVSLQVYTRLHFISSDPGAETHDSGGLRVRVCPERLAALPHVGCVCRNPAQTELGAGALHHSVRCDVVSEQTPKAHRSDLWQKFILCVCVCLHSSMFLLVIATAYLEAQSIWEPFKRRVSVESNSSLETGRPFNLRDIVQFPNNLK